MVEDDKVDQMAFQRFASAGKIPYDYVLVGSVKEAIEVLGRELFDVVLLDYQLGDGTAFDLFEKVKGTPFIIITGTGDEEMAVRAMKSGAYDYLIKDPDSNYLKTLSVTVENALKIKRSEEELQKYRENLEELVKVRTAELQLEIGEREKAEKALREAHDNLERRVAERTAELKLANEELHQEIKERKRVGTRLKASVKEKVVLLKEIHHRVKNNLQIISSLLRLQSRFVKDKQTIDMFNISQSRIKSMALIHDKLYQSKDLTKINFSDYIKSLTTYLFSAYPVEGEKIALQLDLKNFYLDINRAIPVALIVNEIVSNSLKHAFPDGRGGEVFIKMESDKKGKCRLTLGDNGVGFPNGFDIHKTETLGMKLMHDLASQIHGTIELDKKEGATYKITF